MLINLKPLSLIAIIIFMICLKQSQCINEELLNPKLTLQEILNSKWKFFDVYGFSADIKF